METETHTPRIIQQAGLTNARLDWAFDRDGHWHWMQATFDEKRHYRRMARIVALTNSTGRVRRRALLAAVADVRSMADANPAWFWAVELSSDWDYPEVD